MSMECVAGCRNKAQGDKNVRLLGESHITVQPDGTWDDFWVKVQVNLVPECCKFKCLGVFFLVVFVLNASKDIKTSACVQSCNMAVLVSLKKQGRRAVGGHAKALNY